VAAYDIGDTVRLTATFKNTAGANTDPTAVACTWKSPDGTVTSYTYAGATITRSEAGIYYVDIAPTVSGNHWYDFTGTGTVAATVEDCIFVRESRT
jgi:hypothetical protein